MNLTLGDDDYGQSENNVKFWNQNFTADALAPSCI